MRACTSAIITSAISTSYIITSAIYFCMILLGGNKNGSLLLFSGYFLLVVYSVLSRIFGDNLLGQICAIQIAFASLPSDPV